MTLLLISEAVNSLILMLLNINWFVCHLFLFLFVYGVKENIDLFLFASSFHSEPESPKDDDNPANVAETVFRDLICRASYGNINAVIRPVLV